MSPLMISIFILVNFFFDCLQIRLGIPNPPYSDSSDINAKEEIKLLFNQDENNETLYILFKYLIKVIKIELSVLV
jgi:hypothetical protein